MSTSTGVAPDISTAATVATAVKDVADHRLRSDPAGTQGEVNRVRTAAHTNAVSNTARLRELALEHVDLVSEDVPAAIQHSTDCFLDLLLERLVLPMWRTARDHA